MNHLLIVHGPNLNLLGRREPEKYGRMTLAEIDQSLIALGRELGVAVDTYQSNEEGALVTRLQATRDDGTDGVILNAAAYTHTSIGSSRPRRSRQPPDPHVAARDPRSPCAA